jgi:hypothetical protein
MVIVITLTVVYIRIFIRRCAHIRVVLDYIDVFLKSVRSEVPLLAHHECR